MNENPDLRNKDSELFKAVDGILKRRPILTTYPEGIRDAVEAAKVHQRAARVDVLEKELAETKQRLAEREKLLQPGTGGPSSSSASGTNFDNLPRGQQREALLDSLRRADQAGETVFGR